MNDRTFDYHHFLHKPDDQAAEFLAWAQDVRGSPGIPFEVPDVDARVLPLRKGTETVLLGRPGMCKTTLLLSLAMSESNRIIARGKWDNECVVFVSYEQTAEELSAVLQNDIPMETLLRGQAEQAQLERTAIPMVRRGLWFIGHGLTKTNPRAPRLTPENVYRTVQVIQEEYHRQIKLLCFDYLQIVPVQHARDRIQQVTEIPIRIKELAQQIGCPVVLAAQASREVDGLSPPIPRMTDCQWSSSIEQTADLVLALWRPYNTYGPTGQPVKINDRLYPITDKLLVVKMLKQRFKAGHWKWPLYFDPETLTLRALTVETEPLEF